LPSNHNGSRPEFNIDHHAAASRGLESRGLEPQTLRPNRSILIYLGLVKESEWSPRMVSDRAVLWDMDGTLVDSAEYHWQAWRDTMAHEGSPITHEQFLATFGQRNDSILRQWLGEKITPESIQRIGDAKEELYRRQVRQTGIAPLPGSLDWVRSLHRQGWGQAIASAAPRANIETILDVLKAGPCFEAIVSADDVHRGKPDPEVFLVAATKLGVRPERCVVVEDALHGIEAARAAGMRSVGVSQDGKPMPADIVVHSLNLLDSDTFDRLLRNESRAR
jgi:beta-phosphoglucomutase family hydrolase